MDCLTSLYCGVFFLGALSNGILGLSLCCASGAKSRSPLLLGVVFADFLVCTVTVPVAAALYVLSPVTQVWMYFGLFIQNWPISAATLSMMALSLDRYLTVRNYRPTPQVASRKPLLYKVLGVIWILAAVFSFPEPLLPFHPLSKLWSLVVAFIFQIVPAFAITAGHWRVYCKLTALSLTARAQHGELPLPMPLMRRPTNMIIVAGIHKPEHIQLEITKDVEEPPQPQASTLRSRRKLANCLMWMALAFTTCWTPHVVCQFLKLKDETSLDGQRYCLLFGQFFSAINPFLYWAMTHQFPYQKWKRFMMPNLYRSASSTNEAALGPFNPKLIRPPPRRRRSSYYLY